jgi:hypothetical protein
MIPFKDQLELAGMIIRYHASHECASRFATEDEARKWIVENAEELDE